MSSCGGEKEPEGDGEAGDGGGDSKTTLRVVASTTMVAELARVIGGDHVGVIGLMGAGVDPHMYQLPPRSLVDIKKADLVFYNGLHLEGKVDSTFEDQKSRGTKVVAVGDVLKAEELIAPEGVEGHPDPHIWGDISLWIKCIAPVEDALIELDADHSEDYRARAAAYRKELEELHAWAKARIEEIPEGQRVLVTSHDAFNYFGRAYGLEVIGLQGISTDSEVGLGAIPKMADFIKERKIKAVFGESSVNANPIKQLAEAAGVGLGGELFSDAMGVLGEMETNGGVEYDLGTYPGMIRHNVNAVVDGLR